MADRNKILQSLSKPFPVEDVKQRRQGGIMLDYISIDATINRLNDVLGPNWNFEILKSEVFPDQGAWAAFLTGRLSIVDPDPVGNDTYRETIKFADGIGASVQKDADNAAKTALAEALKKAGHQLGIGLYLWDEREREVIAKQRAGAPDGPQLNSDADVF